MGKKEQMDKDWYKNHKCPKCGGTGRIKKVSGRPFEEETGETFECDLCNGSGEVSKYKYLVFKGIV